MIVGLVIAVVPVVARVAGLGAFESYPTVSIDTGWPTLVLSASIPLAAALPVIVPTGRGRPTAAQRGSHG